MVKLIKCVLLIYDDPDRIGFIDRSIEAVCEQSQLNFVLVYVVENSDVFADDGDGIILFGLGHLACRFYKGKYAVQYIHHRIPRIV